MSNESILSLYFSSSQQTELTRCEFTQRHHPTPLLSVRGKTNGAYQGAGTFQWSTGVRGVCFLALKTILSSLPEGASIQPYILGEKETLAASLDSAISKQPDWIVEMFGRDKGGHAFAKRLFNRTNAERKRAGPVVVAFNEHILSPENISIVLDGKMVRDCRTLALLASHVEQQGKDGTHIRKSSNGDYTVTTRLSVVGS
jgi:hypothetical protein